MIGYFTVKVSVLNISTGEYFTLSFIVESETEHSACYRALSCLHYSGYRDCEIIHVTQSTQDELTHLITQGNLHKPVYH